MNISREILGLKRFARSNAVELLLILLLFTDLFIKLLPVPLLVFPLLVLQFCRLDLCSNIVLCLQCLSVVVGAALNTMGISGLGGFITVVGVVLLLYGISRKQLRISRGCFVGLVMLVLMLAYFGISALLSTGGDFAGQKYLKTLVSGLLFWLSFVVLFSNIRRANTNRLGIYFILYSFYLLRLSIPANTIQGPSGLMDFAFMRTQSIATLGYIPVVFNVFYQLPGQFFMQGLGIFLLRKKSCISVPILVFLLGFVLVLYAGARQMIITIMVVFLMWLVFKFKAKSLPFVIAFVLLVPALYLSSASINELFSSTVEDGYVEGGGRGLWLLSGVEQFLERPVFGVGFGRFNLLGDYTTYPHNLFVEILCETGIVGFVFVFSLLVLALWFTRKKFKSYVFYFVGLFMMSMASGAIYDNIILFALVFAFTSNVRLKIKFHESVQKAMIGS